MAGTAIPPARPASGKPKAAAAAPQAPAAFPRPRMPAAPQLVATARLKKTTSSGMRNLASQVQQDHPDIGTHDHLTDAAAALDRGNPQGAKRHLQAAMHTLAPGSLYRHGITDDQSHAIARQNVNKINRHLLRVSDVQDAQETNEQRLAVHKQAKAEAKAPQPGVPPAQPANLNAPRNSPLPGPFTPKNLGEREKEAAALVAEGIRVIELSARTAMLARTPAPRGRPGGPGLYDVQGNEHSAYLQQIVKALIEKRGMPPGKAYAIARGAIRKWMRGGGKVHPEVIAAAGSAEAQELKAQARAHAHASDFAGPVIELFNPYHAPTGQFTTASGTGAAAGGKAKAKQLHQQAAADRQKAARLRRELHQLVAQLRSQRHSQPHHTAGNKAGKVGPGKKSATKKQTAAKHQGAAQKAQHAAKPGASLSTRITQLRGEIQQLLAQAKMLDKRANAL